MTGTAIAHFKIHEKIGEGQRGRPYSQLWLLWLGAHQASLPETLDICF